MLKLVMVMARIERKIDHLTDLIEEVLAYLDGMDNQKRSGDEWRE